MFQQSQIVPPPIPEEEAQLDNNDITPLQTKPLELTPIASSTPILGHWAKDPKHVLLIILKYEMVKTGMKRLGHPNLAGKREKDKCMTKKPRKVRKPMRYEHTTEELELV